MDQSQRQKDWLANAFSFFFFCGLIYLAIHLGKINPIYTWSLAALMTTLGLFSIVWAALLLCRYKNVFDFEPALFLGRLMNGKRIRGILTPAVYAGVWSVVEGGFLLLLLLNDMLAELL
jgi:hypothetical protein